MVQILKFIDSVAIREYNKETIFTPAEQAVLIVRSMKTTLEEKRVALQELIDTYGKEQFGDDSIHIYWEAAESCVWDMVKNTLIVWNYVLEHRKEQEGFIYIAETVEQGFNRGDGAIEFFSSYEKAFRALQREKKYYEDDDDLRKVNRTAYIYKIRLNQKNNCTDSEMFWFDGNLRLLTVSPSVESYGKAGVDKYAYDIEEQCYMHLPLPFQKGDIVKFVYRTSECNYGVFFYTPVTKEKDREMEWGDGSDMLLTVECYDSKTDKWFAYDDIDPNNMEWCSEDELPEKEKMLESLGKLRKQEGTQWLNSAIWFEGRKINMATEKLGEFTDYEVILYMDERFKLAYCLHANEDYPPCLKIYKGKLPYDRADTATRMTRISLLDGSEFAVPDQNAALSEAELNSIKEILKRNGAAYIETIKKMEERAAMKNICVKLFDPAQCRII